MAIDLMTGSMTDATTEALLGDQPLAGWQRAAACRGMDQELFFPERGDSTTHAKAVCAECPVRPECLAMALARRERFGIWGGFSERERRRLRRRIARGADIDTVVDETLRRGRAA